MECQQFRRYYNVVIWINSLTGSKNLVYYYLWLEVMRNKLAINRGSHMIRDILTPLGTGKKNVCFEIIPFPNHIFPYSLTLSSFFITRAICIKIGSMPLMSLSAPAAYSSLEILILCGIYIVPFTPKHFTVITNWYKRITSSTPDMKSPLWWNQLFNHVDQKRKKRNPQNSSLIQKEKNSPYRKKEGGKRKEGVKQREVRQRIQDRLHH